MQWIPPSPVFCKGKDGERRRITYFDVLKDFYFMAAKGFDYGFIQRYSESVSSEIDVFSSKNVKL